ncbi:MAG: hypothetical protein KF808_04175 [Cryobacterium sp.]|nr:hypothetical protein [Cryobacterium sp.]
MAKLFRNPRRPAGGRSRTRRPNPDQVINRVGLDKLAPEPKDFLGRAAYLQLSFFELLAQSLGAAPSMASKQSVARAAEILLNRHLALVSELERSGVAASEQMELYSAEIDVFQRRIRGVDWFETMLGFFVASGILDEALSSIALGLPAELSRRMAGLFEDGGAQDVILAEFKAAIESNPKLASRLALFGRSLVGDVFLIARSALNLPEGSETDEERLEPAFTELIASHTRRMDELGLTA